MHAPLASTLAGRRRGRAESLAAAAIALAFAAAALWAIFARGPWYDEFYTLYVASPRFPLAAALTAHWLPDNHPPLFYALARATAFLGEEAAPRRLLNLALLAAAAGAAWVLLRGRGWGVGLALALAAQPASLLAASELRSYFASLAAATVLTVALTSEWLDPGGPRARRMALWAAALVAFNLHIVTTIVAAALFAPFVAAALLRREWRKAAGLALPAACGAALFAVVTALQLPHWLGNTRGFWIPAGFDAARWPLEHLLVRTLSANPVVLAGALAGLALLARDVWRRGRTAVALEAIGLLSLSAALAAVVLIALHLLRPLVMEKYLIALIPVIATGLALGFARALDSLGRWQTAALAAAALWSLAAIVGNAREAAAMNSWDRSATALARIAARCPDSAVHIDPAFANAYTMSLSPADNRAVVAFAYRDTARRHGLRLEPAGSRRVSARCPTLFWGEHDTSRRVSAAGLLARERARGFALERLRLVRVGDGWIAADRPL